MNKDFIIWLHNFFCEEAHPQCQWSTEVKDGEHNWQGREHERWTIRASIVIEKLQQCGVVPVKK